MATLNANRLDEEFQLLGVWFLTGQAPEKGITGTLHFKQDEIRLELYGSFGWVMDREFREIEYILGWTKENKSVVLHNCSVISGEIISQGFSTVSYMVDEFFIFQAVSSEKNRDPFFLFPKFFKKGYRQFPVDNIRFSFHFLNDWMKQSSIMKIRNLERKILTLEADLGKYKIDRYEIPTENFVISNSIHLSHTQTSMSEEHFWNVKSMDEEGMTFQQLLDGVISFRNLVEFFVDAPLKFNVIEFSSFIPETVRGRFFFIEKGRRPKKFISSNMFYPALKSDFDVILKNWFLKHEDLQFIIDSYLSDLYLRYYAETQLLNSIRNLEVYHRNFVDDTLEKEKDKLLEQEKETLIQFIRENISEANQERFIRNIVYYPEQTLNNRLKQLFNLIPDELAEITIKKEGKSLSKSKNALAFKLTQTRNFYTHGDTDESYIVVINDGAERYEVNEKLKMIIKFFIYKELGLPTGKILDILLTEYEQT